MGLRGKKWRQTDDLTSAREKGLMQPEARSKQFEAVSTHPLAELLACPSLTNSLLTASAQSIGFQPGDVIFSQTAPCLGLYLVISGQLLRRAERLAMRLTLGMARSGDLVELGGGGVGRAGRPDSYLHPAGADPWHRAAAADRRLAAGIPELPSFADALAGGTGPG